MASSCNPHSGRRAGPHLIQPNACHPTFTADRNAFPPLAGTPVEFMFGPEQPVDLVLYSEGWGLEGQGSALLYFMENGDGNLVWFAMVYSEAHFDQ